jgi:hypothetical protein
MEDYKIIHPICMFASPKKKNMTVENINDMKSRLEALRRFL